VGYGLWIWDQYGNKILDPDDYVARLVHVETVPPNASGSIYINEADGKAAFVVPSPGPNFTSADKYLTVPSINSTGTLSWSNGGSDEVGETLLYVYVLE
jgi:hypothetical protein